MHLKRPCVWALSGTLVLSLLPLEVFAAQPQQQPRRFQQTQPRFVAPQPRIHVQPRVVVPRRLPQQQPRVFVPKQVQPRFVQPKIVPRVNPNPTFKKQNPPVFAQPKRPFVPNPTIGKGPQTFGNQRIVPKGNLASVGTSFTRGPHTYRLLGRPNGVARVKLVNHVWKKPPVHIQQKLLVHKNHKWHAPWRKLMWAGLAIGIPLAIYETCTHYLDQGNYDAFESTLTAYAAQDDDSDDDVVEEPEEEVECED